MDNKVFLLGLFLLSVANVKAQTQTQNDSLTMENMMHNLPEIMVKGSRPIVKAERGMLSYNMPLLMKQYLPTMPMRLLHVFLVLVMLMVASSFPETR